MALTHIQTSSGFEIDIEEEALDDMEVLELVFAIEDGNMKSYINLVDKIMSHEDKRRLYEHVRIGGRVPIEKFGNELTEIMKELKTKKK